MLTTTPTAAALIREGAQTLKDSAENFSSNGGWRHDAKELLTFAAGEELQPRDVVPAAARRKFDRAIRRRAAGEPIPYITGVTEFDGLELTVRKGAFVPRWTTEAMAAEAVKRLRNRTKPVHVDLATGIGPVALAAANRVGKAKVHGVDLSAKAVALAKENAAKLGLRNATFHRGSLFDPLPRSLRGKVDVVTIHPPYVAAHEIEELPAELKDFEPVMSLTDRSNDGLELLERTADECETWLKPGGWLIVEIGSYLARRAHDVVAAYDFSSVEIKPGALRYNKLVCARR